MRKGARVTGAFVAAVLAAAACATPAPTGERASTSDWIPLFNGLNLDGWRVKISGYELDENFGDTFRVEHGLLRVVYDRYDEFGGRFGHLFHEVPYSHYRLRVEYRFFGGMSEKEIAHVLGVTDRTVRRDWQKARALLKTLLADYTPPDVEASDAEV